MWEVLKEMERFNGNAKEEDQGAVALVLDLAKAFERVSLLDAPELLQEDPASAVRVFRVNSSKSRYGPSRVKWSYLLLRIVLQDALIEVTKICPPLKLRVFLDDITVLLMEKNKVMVEMAKKVMKKLKRRGREENGLKLSVTKDGREGWNEHDDCVVWLPGE